jgi:hypothetical protein
MSSNYYPIPNDSKQEEKMNETAGEELSAIIDELLNILHQPALPSGHPGAPGCLQGRVGARRPTGTRNPPRAFRVFHVFAL